MSVDLARSGVNLVRYMQSSGDMENSWMIFDQVKRPRKLTTVSCHAYGNKHYKVSTIACCAMELEVD